MSLGHVTHSHDDAKPDAIAGLGRFRSRIILGTAATLSFTVLAVAVYQRWIPEATMNARRPQPLSLTVGMCLLVIGVFAILQWKTRIRIAATGLIGLIVGVFLFPASSMIPESRVQAILSGDYAQFAPFAICVGACIGTIVGQNLTCLQKQLNWLNDSWRTSDETGAQSIRESCEDVRDRGHGQRSLTSYARKDFHQELIVPTAAFAF